MTWDEFNVLVAGLTSDTPLGNVISIRSENDGERLKSFTTEQHKMRRDWALRQARINPEYARQQASQFQGALKSAFSNN